MAYRDSESLTRAQREAVEHMEGPLLILAGPGSGKTRVITHRIAHLIDEGVSPREILALTFTNKAADEMKQRVARLVPDAPVWIGTFHRFCSRLLRRYADHVGLNPNFTIYDSSDSLRALKHAMQGLNFTRTMTSPERLAHEISWTKNHLISADEFQPSRGHELSSIMCEVYPAYQKQLLTANAVDFDDLLLHVAKLLQESPEIRATLDRTYRFVMVDEYQDTNLAQYMIARALNMDDPNLAVTGDPDQSIYGWRGANLSNILDFEQDYPSVRVVRLEQNYRSTPSILSVADSLIRHNVRRKHKELFTENPAGTPVRLIEYATEKEEAQDIVRRIAEEVHSGRRTPADFAIFYRINALSRALEHTFRDYGVPYQIVNGMEFYQRKEVKDAMAYLRLINNPRDDVSLLRIINVPARRIGKATIDRLADHARHHGSTLLEAARQVPAVASISKNAAKRVQQFVALLDRLNQKSHASVEKLLRYVLKETGYLDQLKNSDFAEDQDRAANLEELVTAAREFDAGDVASGGLEAFLEQTALVSDTDAWDQQSHKVTLMTLHAAKGLEFPVVFIVAVEHRLLPHERSLYSDEQLEEERRLLFVGITRAQQQLQLSLVKYRSYRGSVSRAVPSAFLAELPRAEMDVTISSSVTMLRPDLEADELGADGFAEDTQDVFGQVEPDLQIGQAEPDLQIRQAEPLKTAAELLDAGTARDDLANPPPVDPDVFRVGMTVIHPRYGPGKITALQGQGKQRTGTINFATAGQKHFVLAKSPLRPLPTRS